MHAFRRLPWLATLLIAAVAIAVAGCAKPKTRYGGCGRRGDGDQ